ncbi:type I restriction-modification system subunit M N-terminal domain-containing protein [Akkermansiaceae bacterium]|nr:type I restriction-modification system subunit M N-terminal domain-containing protein [Akkermansiaceae bacterium]
MGADEFRDYILGFIFYKYLSERMHLFADDILKNDGIKFDAIDESSSDGQEMLDDSNLPPQSPHLQPTQT